MLIDVDNLLSYTQYRRDFPLLLTRQIVLDHLFLTWRKRVIDVVFQLVTILVSDVGCLNTVYEVWKHGGGHEGDAESFCGLQAMEQSRQASRGAAEWRKGIAAIADLAMTFDTSILKPANFSPLR